MECECERLKVCGTCVHYVARHEGCLMDFVRWGSFSEYRQIHDDCTDWTPYWKENTLEGGMSDGAEDL